MNRGGVAASALPWLFEEKTMTKVAILPVRTSNGVSYVAIAGDKQSQGASAGAALDALAAQLTEDESDTLVIVQSRRPDPFFNAAQIDRLADLMARWRSAQETGGALSEEEQAELKALVEAELRASAARAAAVADGLGR
jgi:hypothetical protein